MREACRSRGGIASAINVASDDVRSAFDLKREDPNVVERYGRASRLLLGLRLRWGML
jgi:hypothetical protein